MILQEPHIATIKDVADRKSGGAKGLERTNEGKHVGIWWDGKGVRVSEQRKGCLQKLGETLLKFSPGCKCFARKKKEEKISRV